MKKNFQNNTKVGTIGVVFSLLLLISACSSGGDSIETTTSTSGSVFKKSAPHAEVGGPNNPGIQEPVLTSLKKMDVRIPNTDQTAIDPVTGETVQLNVVGDVVSRDAKEAESLLGHQIRHIASPNDDLAVGLQALEVAAAMGDQNTMTSIAERLKDILLGTTEGEIYDGFAMLNYNKGAYVPDHLSGEYKTKLIRDTGLTAPGIDGIERRIWEVNVNMLWYDDQFDADTFMIRVPTGAHEFDTLRVHYKIYSLVREEFSPTTVMVDKKTSVSLPFKGFDSSWVPVKGDTVTEITIDHPPLSLLRGVYTWGWRQHPPRIHFLQPIFEIINAHTGKVELAPQGKSFAERNRTLSIEGIGEAAPEKKIYNIVQAVLSGTGSEEIQAMLTKQDLGPQGVWTEWADLLKNQLQLPPEAWEVLKEEGIEPGKFGDYRFVSVYLNNEMYGDGPRGGGEIEAFGQGDTIQVKVINLDNHTHYFRNVDFGKPLHNDIGANIGQGSSHSFEIFNFKPTYGAPKAAEMQWRAGWGFRPHFDVIQQQDVFPRPEDQVGLQTIFDGEGAKHLGYQYSSFARQGDFRFNPPNFIIGKNLANPSTYRLKEADGSNGLLIGQKTEGYGIAKMCSNEDFPMGQFCGEINPLYNPHGKLNFPPPPSGKPATKLRFPPFLRNPNANGGDIIAPTPIWKPFFWINPNNGTLWINPDNHDEGYWADLTYAHGAPVKANTMITATIEAPRASGEVFYQFDDLFHDNAIFSPHAR